MARIKDLFVNIRVNTTGMRESLLRAMFMIVTPVMERPAAGARDDVDRHLAVSLQLATLPGTAAFGVRVGRLLERGDVWHPTSDREWRFAQAELQRRDLAGLRRYEILGPVGEQLVAGRGRFLSEKKVRDCYGGYAWSQFQKLLKTGSFGSDLGPRREKHARHLFRLLEQGEQLLTTGTMDIRVADPDRIREHSKLDDEAMVVVAEAAFERFGALPSVLPDAPDWEWANQLLVHTRLGR